MTRVMDNEAPTARPQVQEHSAHQAPPEPRVDPATVQEGIVCRTCWQVHPVADPTTCPTCGAARPADGWAAMPFRLSDRYQFNRLLGRGAMGAVFLAIDLQAPLDAQGHAVARAIKVGQRVDAASLAVQAARFEHEVAAAGLLGRSPAYVRTYGYDLGHEPYLIMELVKWPTLAKVLRAGRLTSAQATQLAIALLEALEIMHFFRLVHRDLKPSNMFVDDSHGSFQVKVADLGIWLRDHDAVAPASMTTDDRIIHGTPPYMSPEQMQGNTRVGARSDLHAVGSIIWECVTGAVPFPAVGATALEQVKLRRNAVNAPLERPAGMSPGLFDVLVRALAPHPDDRFDDCRAMIAALERAGVADATGQGWVAGALEELAALKARLAEVRLDAVPRDARKTVRSIERGLEMLAEYLAVPGATEAAARKLLKTVRRDLVAVVELADDPYHRADAGDPTADASTEPDLPATVDLPATMPGVDVSETDTSKVSAPPPTVERYTRIRMVGAGSTARIFAARQTELDREVAVRVLHPEGVSRLGIADREAFFRTRARAASRLIHPNITPVLDYAIGPDGLPYRVEAFVPGPTLLQRLKAERCLPPTEVVRLGARLASALAAAHAAGVVHLNLKPGRVILQPRPGLEPSPAVFGFGFDLETLDDVLGRGRRYGTPAYMAPEQLAGQQGAPADVHALGTILFRLTTGLLPFWGESLDALLEAKRSEAPFLPERTMRGDAVGTLLRGAVADMLMADPEARPSAAAIAARLSARVQ